MLHKSINWLVILALAFCFELVTINDAEARKFGRSFKSPSYSRMNTGKIRASRMLRQQNRARAAQRRTAAVQQARQVANRKADAARNTAFRKAKQAQNKKSQDARANSNAFVMAGIMNRGAGPRVGRIGSPAVPRRALSKARTDQLRQSVSRLPLTIAARPTVKKIPSPKRKALIGPFKAAAKKPVLPKGAFNKVVQAGRKQTCSFHGDTLVLTETGKVPIRDIRAGMHRVWSMDEFTGETGWKDVLAQYSNKYDETVYVTIFDPDSGQIQTIISNRIHPFFGQAPDVEATRLLVTHSDQLEYAFDGDWIEAAGLSPGTLLNSSDGSWDEVVAVEVERKSLEAFNLTVDEFHTYFVVNGLADRAAIWVHNDCIKLPNNKAQLKHIFRNDPGHLRDTPNNRRRLLRTARDEKNFVGTDRFGNRWYAKKLRTGGQVWASVQSGVVQNGGYNKIPVDHKSQKDLN